MKTVYLIRHAEFENPHKIIAGRLPLPLSEAGVVQAEKLAKYFANKRLEVIYSSQVLRCRQTAETIRNSHPAKPEVRFDFGILETQSAYQGFWEENIFEGGLHVFAHRDEVGGESLEDIQKRVVAFWNEKVISGPEKVLAVCSHDFCLLTLLKYLKKLPLPEANEAIYRDGDCLPKAGFREVGLDGENVVVGDTVVLA